jgi:hypothetical protein
MTRSKSKGLGNLLWGLLALWFLGVLFAGYNRVFNSASLNGVGGLILLGLSALTPIILFGVWFYVSPAFKEHVLSLNPAILTAVQTWRVGGIVFLILLMNGILPPSFAYPAGIGDMAIGITAPFVAYAWSRKKLSPWGFILWQTAGMADLIVAVTTGVLSSPSKIGILAGGVSTQVMGMLPMSLIPTFAVPLFFILHIICIAQVRKLKREPAGLSGSPSLNLG